MVVTTDRQIVVDTNVLIYWFQHGLHLPRATLESIRPSYSIITQIEALGFWDIAPEELAGIRALLDTGTVVALNENIVDRTIWIRQQKRIKTPDAIVAATAIENRCELWTANTKDFNDIDELKVVNPLKT